MDQGCSLMDPFIDRDHSVPDRDIQCVQDAAGVAEYVSDTAGRTALGKLCEGMEGRKYTAFIWKQSVYYGHICSN